MSRYPSSEDTVTLHVYAIPVPLTCILSRTPHAGGRMDKLIWGMPWLHSISWPMCYPIPAWTLRIFGPQGGASVDLPLPTMKARRQMPYG